MLQFGINSIFLNNFSTDGIANLHFRFARAFARMAISFF